MAKKKTIKSKFEFSRLYPLLNVLLLVCVAANFLVVFFSERQRRPQIVRSIETVITNHLIVVTNYISTASSSDSSPIPFVPANTNILSTAKNSVSIPYHFYVFNDTPFFQFAGRNYKVGSETSYGTVKRIFPDRVFLDSGIWLVNSTLMKKEIAKDDRISNNAVGR